MKKNLFYKIFLTQIVIIAAAMALVGFLVAGQIKGQLTERIGANLLSYAEMASLTSSSDSIRGSIGETAAVTQSRVTLIDADGTVIADSEIDPATMDNHLNRPEIQEVRVKGRGTATRYSRTLDIDTIYVAVPLKDGDTITGHIRFSRPLSEVKDSVQRYSMLVIQAFVVAGILAFIIAFVFTARMLSPINEMEQFTKKLREGDQPGTLLIQSSDEVGRLAQNINYIVAELQDRIQAANEEKGKLEAAFASMNAGVLVLNGASVIENANDAFKKMFTVRYRDIIGKTCLEAFRNVDLQDALDEYERSGESVIREIAPDLESNRTLTVNITPIHGLPQNESKSMIVFHDVTQLKQLEKMRADFVANVTHEIKTPLSAILGFIETLQDGALDDRATAEKFLSTIYRHAHRLNRLVDDLLTISDIELGRISLNFESVSLRGVVENVFPLVEARAAEKQLSIEIDIPDDIPPVRADRDRLAQVFLNLLDNAVKFTPEKERVSFSARRASGEDTVTVTIADTGIGIPRDEVHRLGERFYRVDKARSREMGGTGLGLSIVKHLMAAHGGTITVDSQLGKGTTVTLLFPVFEEGLETPE